MTEPGIIPATIASVISTGARRPGISAVQMTMSVRRSVSVTFFALPALIILAHFARIAARRLGGARGLLVDGDKARAEALDLLLGSGADIGGADDSAEPARPSRSPAARPPRTHHQHSRRLDRARRGHHHRKGAAEFVGGVEHRLVAGELALR